jgi:hypothetical protein
MIDATTHTTQIPSPEDRPLIEEAIRAANAGALRGGYILIWLACAESIKRRFVFASARDGAAAKIQGDWEQKEKDAKSIDLFLLNSAESYGMLTPTDALSLRQIYEKRCVFGHPYEKSPSIEEFIGALSVAIKSLLSAPVLMKHGYLDAQAQQVSTSKTFIDDHGPAVVAYASEVSTKCDPKLIGWWLAKIWNLSEKNLYDPLMPWLIRRVHWIGDALLPHIDLKDFMPTLERELTDKPRTVATALARSGSVFKNLPPLLSDRIVAILLDESKTSASWLVPLLWRKQDNSLNPRQLSKLSETINSSEPINLAESGVPIYEFAPLLIQRLKSYNWNIQNPIGSILSGSTEEEFRVIPPETLEQLGRNIVQAGEAANRCKEFITEVAQGKKKVPPDLVKGMLFETTINDLGLVRPKYGNLINVHMALSKVEESSKQAILELFISKIEHGSAKNPMSFADGSLTDGVEISMTKAGIAETYIKRIIAALTAIQAAVDTAKASFWADLRKS